MNWAMKMKYSRDKKENIGDFINRMYITSINIPIYSIWKWLEWLGKKSLQYNPGIKFANKPSILVNYTQCQKVVWHMFSCKNKLKHIYMVTYIQGYKITSCRHSSAAAAAKVTSNECMLQCNS